jgi:hypothetical protein
MANQFRPFLINIEAFAEIAQNTLSMVIRFIKLGQTLLRQTKTELAVLAMKKLHLAQFGKTGYM